MGEDRAVLAFFGEDTGLEEQIADGGVVIDAHVAGDELDVGAGVGGAANRRRHDEVSIGGKRPGGARNCHARPDVGKSQRDIVGIFAAELVLGEEVEFFGGAREESDGAAHRAVAENAGGGAAGDFDASDFHGYELRPIDPTAEGVVSWDAIPKDEGSAGAGRSDAAQ